MAPPGAVVGHRPRQWRRDVHPDRLAGHRRRLRRDGRRPAALGLPGLRGGVRGRRRMRGDQPALASARPAPRALGEPREQRPRRAAAVADGVLLLRRELGHRAAVGRRRRAGTRGRSRSRRRRAARPRASPVQRPSNTRSSAPSTKAIAQTYASALPAGASRSSARFSSSVASSPAKRAERTPGAPPSAADSMPESSAIAGAAGRRRGGPRLDERVLRERLAGLGRQRDVVGQRRRPRAPSSRPANSRTLCALRVERTSLMPRRPPRPGSRAARAIPRSASTRRSSRCARESGVRSAVACTSTSPPSPVMTTFASTSAVESSA